MTDIPNSRLSQLTKALMDESAKMTASGQMLEAAAKELEAALTLKDWKAVDEARQKCLDRFEATMDIKIAAVRRLGDMNPTA